MSGGCAFGVLRARSLCGITGAGCRACLLAVITFGRDGPPVRTFSTPVRGAGGGH